MPPQLRNKSVKKTPTSKKSLVIQEDGDDEKSEIA